MQQRSAGVGSRLSALTITTIHGGGVGNISRRSKAALRFQARDLGTVLPAVTVTVIEHGAEDQRVVEQRIADQLHRSGCLVGDGVTHIVAGKGRVDMVARTHTSAHTHHVSDGARLAHGQRHAAELHRAHARSRHRRAQTHSAHGAFHKGKAIGGRVDHIGIDHGYGAHVLHLQAVAHQVTNLDGTHGSGLDDAQQRLVRLDRDLDHRVIAVGGVELLADAVVDGVVTRRCSRGHGHLAGGHIQHGHAGVATHGLRRCGHRAGDAVRRERCAVQRVVLRVGIAHHLITGATVARVSVVLGIDGRSRHLDGDGGRIAQRRLQLVADLVDDGIVTSGRASRHGDDTGRHIQHGHGAAVDGGCGGHDLAGDLGRINRVAVQSVVGIRIASIGRTCCALDGRQRVVDCINLANDGRCHRAACVAAAWSGTVRSRHTFNLVVHLHQRSRSDAGVVSDDIGAGHRALGQGQHQRRTIDGVAEAGCRSHGHKLKALTQVVHHAGDGFGQRRITHRCSQRIGNRLPNLCAGGRRSLGEGHHRLGNRSFRCAVDGAAGVVRARANHGVHYRARSLCSGLGRIGEGIGLLAAISHRCLTSRNRDLEHLATCGRLRHNPSGRDRIGLDKTQALAQRVLQQDFIGGRCIPDIQREGVDQFLVHRNRRDTGSHGLAVADLGSDVGGCSAAAGSCLAHRSTATAAAQNRIGQRTDGSCNHLDLVLHAVGARHFASRQGQCQRTCSTASNLKITGSAARHIFKAFAQGIGQHHIRSGLCIRHLDHDLVLNLVVELSLHCSGGLGVLHLGGTHHMTRVAGCRAAWQRTRRWHAARGVVCGDHIAQVSTLGAGQHFCGVAHHIGTGHCARRQGKGLCRTLRALHKAGVGNHHTELETRAQRIAQHHRIGGLRTLHHDTQGVGNVLPHLDLRIRAGVGSLAISHHGRFQRVAGRTGHARRCGCIGVGRITTACWHHFVLNLGNRAGQHLGTVADCVGTGCSALCQSEGACAAIAAFDKTCGIGGNAHVLQARTQRICQRNGRQRGGVRHLDLQGIGNEVTNLNLGLVRRHGDLADSHCRCLDRHFAAGAIVPVRAGSRRRRLAAIVRIHATTHAGIVHQLGLTTGRHHVHRQGYL